MPTYVPPIPITVPSGFEVAGGGVGYGISLDHMVEAGMAIRTRTSLEGNYRSLLAVTAVPVWGLATFPQRGAVGTPPETSGYWIVENASWRRTRGQRGVLTANWIGAFVLPPDDASVDPEDQQPRIERHPLFSPLTPLDFSIIQQAAQAPNAMARNTATQALAGLSNPALGTLLYNKILRGQETYYFPGLIRYTWTKHYYANSVFGTPVAPGLFLGPQIISPAAFGAVPLINQLPATAQYLRLADKARFIGGLEAVVEFTRTWLGVNTTQGQGFWDPDLYS